MSGPDPTIGVVTLTRNRPEMLARAIRSVAAQDFSGRVEHIVVIDDDLETMRFVESLASRDGHTVCPVLVPRPPQERDEQPGHRAAVYPRLSRLFNIGIRTCTARHVAFLDDDNEYEPDHLSSLAEHAATTRAPAVHSGRKMMCPDGSPYLLELFPGAPDPVEAARIFDLMCRRGVWRRSTNILMDRAGSRSGNFRNSTVVSDDDPISLVDQNVWLIDRQLLLEFPIPETFTDEEIRENTCPDDKLLDLLLRNRVRIESSGRATVRYYVGGISNSDTKAQSIRGTRKGSK